jgi:hypothetical protein
MQVHVGRPIEIVKAAKLRLVLYDQDGETCHCARRFVTQVAI